MKAKFVVLTILILISFSENLFACSCIGHRSVKKEIKHSDAVLVGIIISKELVIYRDSNYLKKWSYDTLLLSSPMARVKVAKYELLVEGFYKGKITNDTVIVYTGIGGGDCGYRFEIGEKYIIYGEKETYIGQDDNMFGFPKGKNIYWTYICLRTTKYFEDEINEIEKILKKEQVLFPK